MIKWKICKLVPQFNQLVEKEKEKKKNIRTGTRKDDSLNIIQKKGYSQNLLTSISRISLW